MTPDEGKASCSLEMLW